MFFQSIRDKVESLHRILRKVERTRGAAPTDVADLKRLMLARIAELESNEATEEPGAPPARTPRRAA
jgi:hypothetical protein